MYIYNVHKNEQKGTINMINGRNSCFYYAEISFRLFKTIDVRVYKYITDPYNGHCANFEGMIIEKYAFYCSVSQIHINPQKKHEKHINVL